MTIAQDKRRLEVIVAQPKLQCCAKLDDALEIRHTDDKENENED